ncbi:glycosyltransferase [Couchioplanes azureus]|uniref:glycosyltransferase n=1 Tax=Couchioplanes caeruleus TaxID=56438 RepID=UPI00167008F1|nr:glycosyltransferase [Couchioplanes caeruleus]GGQ47858.1 glucosyltransferase [Couchioplanes caeruleus subsp. azureus]
MPRRVVIWRSGLLAASETFIRDQGLALRRWRATFVGATRVASAQARDDDVIVFPGDPAGFLRLRLTGRSPRLSAALAETAPAVVHAHFAGDGWLVHRAAAEAGAPLVVTLHGHDVSRQPRAGGVRGARHRRHLRVVLRRAALVLAVSAPLRDLALAHGADPARIRVHHTGVTIPPAGPPAPTRWDVAFVGRFVPKKGTGDLVTALGMLADLRPRAVFIGDGPLAAAARERAAVLRLDATFLGMQDHGEVRRALAASRILAAPSRTAPDGDMEGLPTTILEASARGVPVVSTRHSGIPEAVVHGETGLLGAEGDPAALAAHLRRLLTDEELRQRLGRQARAYAATHFDLHRQTGLLEGFYEEVSDGAATSGRPARPRGPRPPASVPPGRRPGR